MTVADRSNGCVSRDAVESGGTGSIETLAVVTSALPTSLLARIARQQSQSIDFATSNVRTSPIPYYIAGGKALETLRHRPPRRGGVQHPRCCPTTSTSTSASTSTPPPSPIPHCSPSSSSRPSGASVAPPAPPMVFRGRNGTCGVGSAELEAQGVLEGRELEAEAGISEAASDRAHARRQQLAAALAEQRAHHRRRRHGRAPEHPPQRLRQFPAGDRLRRHGVDRPTPVARRGAPHRSPRRGHRWRSS